MPDSVFAAFIKDNPFKNDYGKRIDGANKGEGWLGKLPMQDGSGKFATELSFDFDANIRGQNQKILAPLIVPTLSKQEINYLLKGNNPTDDIYNKAMDFAIKRVIDGKSPFK